MSTDARGADPSSAHLAFTRPRLGIVVKHLFAIALLISGLIATVWAFLYTATGQQLDETALSEASQELTQYSNSSFALLKEIPLIAGIFAVLGILFVLVRRHRFIPALVGLLIAAGANGTCQFLKRIILEKPNLGVQDATINSLPSGHTAFAASAGAALFLAAPKKWRPMLSLVMFFFTVSTGVATVINEWHRPGDVVASIFVVSAWTTLGLLILRFIPSEDRDTSNTRHTGMLLIPLYTIMGLFMGFCSVATTVVALEPGLPGAALLGSLCMISAVGLLSTSIMVWLLRVTPRRYLDPLPDPRAELRY